jgi:hypothetical protein
MSRILPLVFDTNYGRRFIRQPVTFLGAFKYTEHLTKCCYRTEAQQRPEFCKSPVDCKVQVRSFTVTVTIRSAGHWATASEGPAIAARCLRTDRWGRMRFTQRPAGAVLKWAPAREAENTYKHISYSQQRNTLQTYYTTWSILRLPWTRYSKRWYTQHVKSGVHKPRGTKFYIARA